MKNTAYPALAVICLATFVAAGCAADRVTGPDADLAAVAAEVAGDDEYGTASTGNAVERVTICHIPPGNPENQHTITVGAPAVPAHISQHGDYVGECQIEK